MAHVKSVSQAARATESLWMRGSTQHLQTHSFRKPLGASTTGQKPELDFWYAELCFLHKPECHRLQRGRARNARRLADKSVRWH